MACGMCAGAGLLAFYCDRVCQAKHWKDHRLLHYFLALGPQEQRPTIRVHWMPQL